VIRRNLEKCHESPLSYIDKDVEIKDYAIITRWDLENVGVNNGLHIDKNENLIPVDNRPVACQKKQIGISCFYDKIIEFFTMFGA